MSMSRAFVAIVPPRAALDAVGKLSWRATHRPAELALPRLLGARWTTRAQWHVTLQFLGPRVDLDAAGAALASVRGAPARVCLGGIGGFPSARRASVVWVGLSEGAGAVSHLAAAVGEAMAALPEVPPDEREYHPHLTLARLARPADLRAVVAVASAARVGPPWVADRLVLFESVTAPTGARYRAHAHVALEA
jgi:RNA 2',3'-cyclic 3'-phosphodiesterase